MNNWLDKFCAWMKGKNITTHSIAVFAGMASIVITANAYGSRDALLQLFHDHPKLGSDLVLLAGVIAAYKRSSSMAGTLANARAINDAPGTPTLAQIDAADPKLK